MTRETQHWTERTTADFIYSLGADFVHQLETEMKATGTTRVALAAKLGVSVGRVSQVLNNPGNLTLGAIVRYARACGRKVSVVTYDDGDSENKVGPVRAGIFTSCWELAGKPHDFFQMDENKRATNVACIINANLFSFQTDGSRSGSSVRQSLLWAGPAYTFMLPMQEGWSSQAWNRVSRYNLAAIRGPMDAACTGDFVQPSNIRRWGSQLGGDSNG